MNEIIPVLRSPLTNLDSLVSFYQQERMWIRRTRAELQDSDDDDDEGPSPRPRLHHLLNSHRRSRHIRPAGSGGRRT